jgi:hypothetical protein
MFVAYLAIGFLIMLGILLALRAYASSDPVKLAHTAKWVAIALGVIGFALIMLRVPLGTLLVLLSGLLPLILRWRAQWQQARAAAGPSGGQASQIDTRYLSMVLDHDSGRLDGTVLAGPYRGRRLGELSLAQILEIRDECLADDPESATVLEAYLDRVHGADWREAKADQGGGKAGPTPTSSAMTREEAYEILGLSAGAGEAEIRDAHRRLMLKLHPDQGGSNYLAAKINQAKDLLLGD